MTNRVHLSKLLVALAPVLNRLGIPERSARLHLVEMMQSIDSPPSPYREGDRERAKSILRSIQDQLDQLDDCLINWKCLQSEWIPVVGQMATLDHLHSTELYSHYSTDPETARLLLGREQFSGPVHEPCCGEGSIARVLEEHGCDVIGSDVRLHGEIWGDRGVDVFSLGSAVNVVTNPPETDYLEIANHLVRIATGKVALLLRSQCLERRSMPTPSRVYLLRGRRQRFAPGGNWDMPVVTKHQYSWFVWDKEHRGPTEHLEIEVEDSI